MMQLLAISLNAKRVPIELRERLAFSESELSAATAALKNEQSVLENVILSTCNRTEIYAVVDQPRRGEDYIKRFLSTWFHLPVDEFSSYLEIHHDLDVAAFLFRVTCGLESLIVGEEQILAQVKASLDFAQENQTSGSVLNTLFRQAIALSKRAHTETALSRNSVSMGSAAVALAKRELGTLTFSHILLIGAGAMGGLSAKYLAAQKVARLTIANRTYEKAKALADKFACEAVPFDDLEASLIKADLVFSATASKNALLTTKLLQKVQEQRKNRPLLLFDLALPRDIEPQTADLPGIKLYDIDDFRDLMDINIAARHEAEKEVEAMIASELTAFEHWRNNQEVFPVIAALQEKAMTVQQQVMNTVERKLPELTEHERKIVNKLTKSIVNQLLREPILQVKDFANRPNSAEKLNTFKKIFGLEEGANNDFKI